MNNLNSILIEGNLTRDPQEKSIDGTALSSFSIACNRYYKKEGEQMQEVSYFHVDVWGKTAEYCNQYLKKGSGVRVVGRLKQDRWNDKDDSPQSFVKIIGEHVDFFPSKKSNKQASSRKEDEDTTPISEEIETVAIE